MGSRRRSFLVLTLVVVLLGGSAWAIATKPTVLGLDLQGGTELVYEAIATPQNPEIDADDMDRAIEIVRNRVDQFGVAEPEIAQVGEQQIAVSLPNVDNADEAIEQVDTTAQLLFYDFEGGPGPDEEPNVIPQDEDVQGGLERPYNRLYDAVTDASKRQPECFQDLCTTNGPTYYLFDSNTLELLAGPTERREDLFLKFGGEQPENSEVKSVPQGTVVVRAEPGNDDPATEDVDESESQRGWFVLRDRPELTGDQIRNPEQNFDQFNQPVVTFEFTDEGRRAFHEVTQRIANRGSAQAQPGICNMDPQIAASQSGSFAVVLDGEIQSRPIINFCENPGGIDGRTGAQISGIGSLKEAQDLATVLRIGALPVKLQLINESQVSATLGQQALDEGLVAGIVGLILVLIFLVAYYRFLGVVAGLGLLVYAVFFLALIKIIPITMTLPGIAGLILTIGVAADSNIVIFERIKEELRKGRSMLSAIAVGYRRGIATIIDANVIILITSFILFVLASAGVKGFAFTLGVGTVVALFTAVLFTQAILAVLGRSRILRSPRFLGASEEQRVRWNFDFMGASKWFFLMSAVILIIGAAAFATKQFNLGIDFESGSRITAAVDQEPTVEEVRNAMMDEGIVGAESAKIQLVEDDSLEGFVVQIQAALDPEQAADVRPALDNAFGLAEQADGSQAYESTTVGPTFGEQIARSASIAIIFSLIVICIYVAIRFEAKYAVPVLIALVHDILITAGVYAVVDREVTSATVAALLTILGLSMYDTIIVFDRVRENVPRMPRAAFSQIVNRSVSEVMTRSIITGLSTVFVLATLLIFGGETLRDFSFAMMIGVASGFYSSLFIATPVLAHWKEREHTYEVRRAQIEEAMGYVPTFPEDNVVAKLGEDGKRDDAGVATAVAPRTGAAAAAVAEADEPRQPAAAGPGSDEPASDDEPGEDDDGGAQRAAGNGSKAARRKQRQRRRKHGRRR